VSPLSDRMRPRRLEDVVGQAHLVGEKGALVRMLEAGTPSSVVLWGPPGSGKTTIARLIAEGASMPFTRLSAVLDGVKELRGVLETAEARRRIDGRSTLLFVDEIHRWNKAQQDGLLPHLESGLLVLVGATTENPSFSLVPALRSRAMVVHLEPLVDEDIHTLLVRACNHPDGVGPVPEPVLRRLTELAAGDARRALDDLDRCVRVLGAALQHGADVDAVLQRSDVRHDRDGEDHFAVASAFIKSLRGSDPDAAIYWLARLIAGGEDPLFIARRLMIFAAEDVGNADPRGLTVAVAAAEAVSRIGMPEGRIPLAQATTWLACCPKSNASYLAINAALAEVQRTGALPVPLHLRNPSSQAGKQAGYGDGYKYPHDFPYHVVAQHYLPKALEGRKFYEPVPFGEEKVVGERLAFWRKKLDGGG
jgi:putative ATPase